MSLRNFIRFIKKTWTFIHLDYVQVNADSGDEHDIEDNRYNRQLIDRNQAQIASTSHSFPTCDTLDSTEPLNDSRPTIVDDIIDMGTNTAPPINDADNGNRTANNWDKFRLLMWKNSLLQWRHKVQTVVEILVPVLFSVILIFIRSMVDPDYYSEPTNYEPFEINTIDPLRLVHCNQLFIWFILEIFSKIFNLCPIKEKRAMIQHFYAGRLDTTNQYYSIQCNNCVYIGFACWFHDPDDFRELLESNKYSKTLFLDIASDWAMTHWLQVLQLFGFFYDPRIKHCFAYLFSLLLLYTADM